MVEHVLDSRLMGRVLESYYRHFDAHAISFTLHYMCISGSDTKRLVTYS